MISYYNGDFLKVLFLLILASQTVFAHRDSLLDQRPEEGNDERHLCVGRSSYLGQSGSSRSAG